MKKYRTISVSLLILFLGILLASPLARAEENQDKTKLDATTPYKEQIEADGYEYTYEAVPDPNQDDREKIRYVGKITIQDKHNNIFYQETTDLEPGSDDEFFPRLSKWPVKRPNKYNNYPVEEKWLVAIYGSHEGRQQTLKIFFHIDEGLRSTFLNFGDTTPNLTRTEDGGGYTAEVYRRIYFPKVPDGFQNCLTVYKLQAYGPIFDDTLFAFIPIFGPEMSKPYLEWYKQQKERLDIMAKDNFSGQIETDVVPNSGQILSALIATQDKRLICNEIETLKRYGLTDEDLLTVLREIKDIGYPGFNPTDCKVK